MKPNNLETRYLMLALAGSLTPTTLASVLKDLAVNAQPTEFLTGLADYAQRQLKRQLVSIVGEAEAERLLKN